MNRPVIESYDPTKSLIYLENMYATDGLKLRGRGKTSKLILTLESKKHYVLHYQNLVIFASRKENV